MNFEQLNDYLGWLMDQKDKAETEEQKKDLQKRINATLTKLEDCEP